MDCENKITLRGFVFIDENKDGLWQYTEKGIKNTSIDLTLDEKVILTYKTKDTGGFVFDVCPANYTIKANYEQGDDSYLGNDTLKASTSASDYNFIVLKDDSVNYNDYIWLVAGIVGFGLFFIFAYLTNRIRRSHSL